MQVQLILEASCKLCMAGQLMDGARQTAGVLNSCFKLLFKLLWSLNSSAPPGYCHSCSWRHFGRLCITLAFQRTKATKCKAAVLYILLSTKHMVESSIYHVIMQLIKNFNIHKCILKIHMLLTSAFSRSFKGAQSITLCIP